MKVVFMGTPEFSAVSLKALLKSAHHVVSVVTVPDKPQGRGRKIKYSAVKELAIENQLDILQPQRLKELSFIDKLRAYDADVFVVVAFRILPEEVFTIPKFGTVNAHASLLPKYRGAAPINWAIINGETKSGVTTMIIDKKVDTGNMLLQKSVVIPEDMNAGQLHDQLAQVSANLLLDSLHGLETNQIKAVIQDHSLATKAPKLNKEMAHINFDRPAAEVHNFIRGLSPYPGAYSFYQNKNLKILTASCAHLSDENRYAAGDIVCIDKNSFVVACQTGFVRIHEVQLQGKKKMSVQDFLNGNNLNSNEKLS